MSFADRLWNFTIDFDVQHKVGIKKVRSTSCRIWSNNLWLVRLMLHYAAMQTLLVKPFYSHILLIQPNSFKSKNYCITWNQFTSIRLRVRRLQDKILLESDSLDNFWCRKFIARKTFDISQLLQKLSDSWKTQLVINFSIFYLIFLVDSEWRRMFLYLFLLFLFPF